MTDIKQQESQVGRFTGNVNQLDVGLHNRVDIIGHKIKILKEKVSIVHEGRRVDIVMCLYHGVGREDSANLALLRRAEARAVMRRRTETAWQ
jgi:hypothetical protein